MAGRLGYCGMDREHLALSGEEVRACWQAPQAAEPWEGLFSELPRPPPPHTERVGDGTVLSLRPAVAATAPGDASTASPRGLRAAAEGTHAAPRPTAIPVEPRRQPVAIAVMAPSSPPQGRLVEAPVVRPSGRIATSAELRARSELRADAEALLEGHREVAPHDGAIG